MQAAVWLDCEGTRRRTRGTTQSDAGICSVCGQLVGRYGNGNAVPHKRDSANDDRTCPDGGRCHHECAMTECFRVRCCGPLQAAGYPDDRWPARIVVAFGTHVKARL